MNKSLLLSLLIPLGLTQSAFSMDSRPYRSARQEQFNSQLHHAIERGEEAEVRKLVEAGTNIHASSSVSCTMPFPAAEGGQIMCDVSRSFDNPLMTAVNSGRESMCELLINLGANVNLRSNYGFTALMRAIQRGHEQICKCLLEHGANVNQENENGDTALMLAAQFGQESIFKLLIDHKANVHHENAKGNTPFIKAARAGWESTCRHLIKLGVNPHHENNDGETAFMETVHVWRSESIPILRSMGKDEEKYKSTCELLIRLGANINHANAQGDTALMIAAGHSENNHPVDPGNEQICKFLIELGANINQANKKGITPLLVSVGCGVRRCVPDRSDEQICKLLIKAGAKVNHQDIGGFTALMHAAQYGYSHICELLLSNDADVNIQQSHGDTALTIAARHYKINALKALITHASFNTIISNSRMQHSPNDQRNNAYTEDFADEPIHGTPICIDASGKVCSALFASDHKLRPALRYLIKNEQEKISIAMYVLTDAPIARELLRAHNRGVKIELLTDPSCLRNPDNKIDILARAGIPIYIYGTGSSGLMHDKFALFTNTIHGKAVIWTGSFNFTKAGNDANQENVVVLDEPHIIRQYTHEFARLRNKATRHIQLDEQIPSLPLQQVRALIQSGKLDKEKAIALIKEHNIACLKPLLQQAILSTHYGRIGLLPNPDTLENDFGTEIENNIRNRIGISSWSEWASDLVPVSTCTMQ